MIGGYLKGVMKMSGTGDPPGDSGFDEHHDFWDEAQVRYLEAKRAMDEMFWSSPEPVLPRRVQASIYDGVLEVRLPKKVVPIAGGRGA
jgi:hypothetical protein